MTTAPQLPTTRAADMSLVRLPSSGTIREGRLQRGMSPIVYIGDHRKYIITKYAMRAPIGQSDMGMNSSSVMIATGRGIYLR